MTDLPAAFECIICGDRRLIPNQTLTELLADVKARGYQGNLIEDGTALAAFCPKCNSQPEPQEHPDGN